VQGRVREGVHRARDVVSTAVALGLGTRKKEWGGELGLGLGVF
jgi:hypothetical protein